jgi:hypothetical protein
MAAREAGSEYISAESPKPNTPFSDATQLVTMFHRKNEGSTLCSAFQKHCGRHIRAHDVALPAGDINPDIAPILMDMRVNPDADFNRYASPPVGYSNPNPQLYIIEVNWGQKAANLLLIDHIIKNTRHDTMIIVTSTNNTNACATAIQKHPGRILVNLRELSNTKSDSERMKTQFERELRKSLGRTDDEPTFSGLSPSQLTLQKHILYFELSNPAKRREVLFPALESALITQAATTNAEHYRSVPDLRKTTSILSELDDDGITPLHATHIKKGRDEEKKADTPRHVRATPAPTSAATPRTRTDRIKALCKRSIVCCCSKPAERTAPKHPLRGPPLRAN